MSASQSYNILPDWVGFNYYVDFKLIEPLKNIFQPKKRGINQFVWASYTIAGVFLNALNPLPGGPFCPPLPEALGLIGPRNKEKKTGFDDVS